jgi:4-hydroxy-tetrahydrodipicolinate synthase
MRETAYKDADMQKLKGVIPAIPTPLDSEENVDANGLKKLIDLVIGKGAAGVFVLGSMGEGTALLDSEKVRAVQIAAEHINARVPLLAGISEPSTRKTIYVGKQLEAGADFLVTTGPYYNKFPHPESMTNFMKDLAENLSKPLVFYDIPGRTGNPVTVDLLEEILSMEKVVALKDSSADFPLIMELLRRYPDKDSRKFSILQGAENMFDVSLIMGVDGVVTGGGTVILEQVVELYNTAVAGQKEKAYKLQQQFFSNLMAIIGDDLLTDWMHALKKELAKMGICEDNVTAPFLKRM